MGKGRKETQAFGHSWLSRIMAFRMVLEVLIWMGEEGFKKQYETSKAILIQRMTVKYRVWRDWGQSA